MPRSASTPLEGKVAIVTGASRRIGRAIALRLADEGATVVVTARSAMDEIAAVAAEIAATGGTALPLLVDVTDEADVERLAAEVADRFGRIDILVNNAANRAQVPFLEMTARQWRDITSVILDGAFFCARAVIPRMLALDGGTIVNIGGLTGHTGAFHRAHVVTAKAGLVGLTKALAVEFADRGVTCNCVVPGKIGGQRSKTSGHEPPMAGDARPLVGREGTFEEVAAMVLPLCLPTGRYITGQTIHVSGGMYLP